MPDCGSQIYLCDLPIRFDTYKGCSHGCKYCFTRAKYDLNDIKVNEKPQALLNFIEGKRNQNTCWCDWDIPLHWGGLSDPFQPCEKRMRLSYECLKIFAKTQYPFIVSTKGKLAAEDEYVELLAKCNCVVQISLVCAKYDELEVGCPPFAERLEMVRKVAPRVKRLIIRVQPYMHEVYSDVYDNLEKFKEAGAYGVIIEGMKFKRKKEGLIKIGGDFVYPYDLILKDFTKLSAQAHALGLRIYSGENRLRKFGDSLTCCGCDGLEDFKPNHFNLNHLLNGEKVQPTARMKDKGTACCFTAINQNTAYGNKVRQSSLFREMLDYYSNEKAKINKVMGVVKDK